METKVLNKALTALKGITKENILLEFVDNGLRLAACNSEAELTLTIPTQDIEPRGQCTCVVNLAELANACKMVREKELSLAIEDYYLCVSSDGLYTKLVMLPVNEFQRPELNDVFTGRVYLNDGAAKDLFSSVEPMSAKNDARYYLHGVLFHVEANKVTTVGTNGHMLAEHTKECDKAYTIVDDSVKMIVPKNSAKVLGKLGTGDVHVHFNDKCMVAKGDGFEFYTQFIIGNYPDHKRVIPTEFATTVSLSKKELLAMIKGMKQKIVIYSINKALYVTNEYATQETTLYNATGDINVALNPRYLNKCLRSIEGEVVTLFFNEENKPVILKGACKDLLCVIMPVRQ